MTKLICVFLVVLPALLCAQPTFTVIKVNGKVTSALLKREVKTGDLIAAKDKLTFANKESYLHVFDPVQGRKTFRNVPDSSPRDLMALLEKFAAKDKSRSKSRGEGTDYLEALSGKFRADTILVLGSGLFPVDTTKLKMKSPAAVTAEFQINQQKQKRTVSSGNAFSLSKNSLFGTTSMTAYPKISLWYFEDANDPLLSPSSPIGFFVPLYVDESSLRPEVNAIVGSLKNRNRQDKMKHILDFLSQEYALAVEENVNDWLAASKVLQ